MKLSKHPTPLNVRFERETLTAIERAAALDERTKADWIRFTLKKELRRLGLLPEHGKEEPR